MTTETETDRHIADCLERRVLPEGIDGILLEARKTLSFGSGLDILYGRMWLRKGIPDGTETNTSSVQEYLPDNVIKTRNSTYLVQWAKETKNG